MDGFLFEENVNPCKTLHTMVKGIDYTGVTISFYCHDRKGNYVMHRRIKNCRDEWGNWDFGGGGLRFNERLLDDVYREIEEAYGTKPIEVEFMRVDEVFRKHESENTHWISFRYKALVNREEVKNNEPEKHDELQWVTLDTLPSPLHSQVASVMEKYKSILRK